MCFPVLGPPDDQILFLLRFAVASETRHSARYRWSCLNRGPEPFVIVQWTHSGTGVFRVDGQDHPVPPGAAFIALVPENAEYRFEPGSAEPWRFAWTNFYGALSLQLWRTLRRVTGPVFPLPPESTAGQSFSQLIANTAARRFADRYDASAAGFAFFMTLCRQLNAPLSSLSRHDRMIAAARQIAGSGPAGMRTGVKSIASEVGVSREHFSRVFKARHGDSPGKFLRLQRLEAAREMLAATGLPLREIAMRCGFTSARHLTDAFRVQSGRSAARTRPSASKGDQ